MQNDVISWHSVFPDEQPNVVTRDVDVSVCLITYNHEKYIAQALESILMQNINFAIEVLVGEDDSTDGTREICWSFATRYPDKIRLFCRKKAEKLHIAGRMTGRVNALRTSEACRGRYIAFLEGDDFWIDRNKLQQQFDFMESHPEFRICGTRCLDWGPMVSRVFPAYRCGNWLSYRELGRFGGGPHTSTFFIRKSSLCAMPAWTNFVVQRDLAILLTFARLDGGIPILPIVTSVYRNFGTGIWSGATDRVDLVIDFWREFEIHAQSSGDTTGLAFARYNLVYLLRWKSCRVSELGRLWFSVYSILMRPAISIRQLRGKLRDLVQ